MNDKVIQAPLKDRMIVYVGVAMVLLFSWLYILGMGWHMNTLPFIDNPTSMNMDMSQDSMPMDKGGMGMEKDKGMTMDKGSMNGSMDMNKETSMITQILTWMPPMGNMWAFSDFFLLFMMWAVMMIAMMTPSILPMLMLYTTLNSRKKCKDKSQPLLCFCFLVIYQAGFYLVYLLPCLNIFFIPMDT